MADARITYRRAVPTDADRAFQVDATPGLLLASQTFGRLDRYLPASYGMF